MFAHTLSPLVDQIFHSAPHTSTTKSMVTVFPKCIHECSAQQPRHARANTKRSCCTISSMTSETAKEESMHGVMTGHCFLCHKVGSVEELLVVLD